MKNNIVDKVNEMIFEAMAKGIVPWHKTWVTEKPTGYSVFQSHRNAFTGRPYNGMNVFLLHITAELRGYGDTRWATFKQYQQAGLNVRRGEHGTTVIFWTFLKVDKDEEGKKLAKPKTIPYLKSYVVFNGDQVDGDKSKMKGSPSIFAPPPVEEAILLDSVKAYDGGPVVYVDGSNPHYRPIEDTVHLPRQWKSEAGKWQVVYHELAHSTGHKTRLDREIENTFGSKAYAREELVAEIASAYACQMLGHDWEVTNTASYLSGWKKKVEDDPMIMIWASSRAEKAVKMMLGIEDDKEEEEVNE